MTTIDQNISTNRAVFVTHSLIEAITRLDEDIETLVAAIPLQKNAAVEAFTKLIREQIGTQSMLAVGYLGVQQRLKEVFGDNPSLLTIRRNSEYCSDEIVPENNIGLVGLNGAPVDLTFPISKRYVIESLSTQADSKKLIEPEFHQDEDMLTINFYAAGKGITYKIEAPNGGQITFKSPCITIHRGTAHRFGNQGAVLHKGHSNEGREAANILWDVRFRPAVMLMLS